jgi:hypothetical protein
MATTTLVRRQTTLMTDPVFKWWDYPIFAVLTIMSLSSLAYFLVYWFSRRDWLYYPIPFAIMTGGLLHYLFLILPARPAPSNQYSPRQYACYQATRLAQSRC